MENLFETFHSDSSCIWNLCHGNKMKLSLFSIYHKLWCRWMIVKYQSKSIIKRKCFILAKYTSIVFQQISFFHSLEKLMTYSISQTQSFAKCKNVTEKFFFFTEEINRSFILKKISVIRKSLILGKTFPKRSCLGLFLNTLKKIDIKLFNTQRSENILSKTCKKNF